LPFADGVHAGRTVYAGRGGRTNGAGIGLLAPLGRTVIAVPLGDVLHLKSAVTALPDGTRWPRTAQSWGWAPVLAMSQ
jgi:dimethylargininase